MSIYKKTFDSNNVNGDSNFGIEQTREFIRAAEGYFNCLLCDRGHVYLNEVYEFFESLGFVKDEDEDDDFENIGWDLNNPDGDGYIQLSLIPDNIDRDADAIYLDFNVDGIIKNQK